MDICNVVVVSYLMICDVYLGMKFEKVRYDKCSQLNIDLNLFPVNKLKSVLNKFL